jgi:hypothetical protein
MENLLKIIQLAGAKNLLYVEDYLARHKAGSAGSTSKS